MGKNCRELPLTQTALSSFVSLTFSPWCLKLSLWEHVAYVHYRKVANISHKSKQLNLLFHLMLLQRNSLPFEGQADPTTIRGLGHCFSNFPIKPEGFLEFTKDKMVINRASPVAQMVKHLPAMWETGFNPCVGKNPGGHGNPLQDSRLENPHGQRILAGYSPRGHKESDTTERLRTGQNG